MKLYSTVLLVVFLALEGFAQQGANRVESYRIAFITNQLQLTPEESQSFWPIYNEYKQELQELRANQPNMRQLLLLDDQELSDFLEKTLNREQRQLELKNKFYSDLKAVLSVRKIVRLTFAEREFNNKILESIRSRNRKEKE